ncbi:hypothetical protein [Microbacterium oleivorans]|uniref:Uncharacterized protein n=1 Tax=Microbacterium oleivorans TaxID=273677 RepID=A0A4R5YGR0_9MICO|nr:hypothetical protein [Microbacterium oleivorans]TDL44005.1 hypothetical protein E2R54_12605 [Microbacterium oleivorans]
MTAPDHDTRLIEVASRLSVAPAGHFVALRKAAAKEADDRDLAAAIGRLRKPVLAAWVVNLLAAGDPQALAPAADLADSFREAVDAADGRALAELATRRRGILRDLVDRAVALAEDSGADVGASVRASVEQTLDAALRDPDAAAAVASARLLRPIEATGMDVPDLTDAVSGPFDAGSAAPDRGDELAERRAAREAERAAAEARRHAESAEKDLARAEERVRVAHARISELEERLAELERERARTSNDLDAARAEAEQLTETRAAARDAACRARKAADRAAT